MVVFHSYLRLLNMISIFLVESVIFSISAGETSAMKKALTLTD